MATQVIMPKFGMAQETGQVIRWYKQEGESVREGEPLLEVMTDKVSMDVEAPASGTLRGVTAPPQAVIPVAETIAYILAPGETWTPPARPTSVATAAAIAAPAAEAAAAAGATPVATRLAAEKQADLEKIPGTGPRGIVTRADVEGYLRTATAKPPAEALRARATPAARRLAREGGVPLDQVSGSGPRGRVQAVDVQAYLSQPAVVAASEPRREEIIPLIGVRKIIAERMSASAQTAPHISLTVHADVTQAEALRNEVNRRLNRDETDKISLTAVLVRIVAWALAKHPWLNARLEADGIHLLPRIHIGVATAVEAGLIVPVVRDADRKSLEAIANEVNDLARRARENRLVPDEVTGSTFTISNLGMYGIETFTAILNPPEAGLLAVGKVIRQPVASEGEGIVVRPLMGMTLSADHRVVDGATAARFLADVKAAVEGPYLLLL